MLRGASYITAVGIHSVLAGAKNSINECMNNILQGVYQIKVIDLVTIKIAGEFLVVAIQRTILLVHYNTILHTEDKSANTDE